MCFAVPARVVEVGPGTAVVERGDARLRISLHLIEEPVAVGDYLAVQAQRHAVAKLSTEEARELFELYRQIEVALKQPAEPPA